MTSKNFVLSASVACWVIGWGLVGVFLSTVEYCMCLHNKRRSPGSDADMLLISAI